MALGKYGNPAFLNALNGQYLNDATADVYFVIESDDGEIERIPAHKFLLFMRSEVFRVMFSGTWEENNDVKIIDASVAAFKEFLQFFYFENVQMTMDYVGDVMRLGQKYLVAGCMNVCEQFLIENLTNENMCSIYGLSILFDQMDLKRFCEVIISVKPTAIFRTNGFLECDHTILGHILKLVSLNCSELKIFEACMEWVRAKSMQNAFAKETVLTFLGDSFYDIRFGLMTIEQINGIFTSYVDLFTDDEQKQIRRLIASKNFRSKMFSNQPRPRQCYWDKIDAVDCDRNVGDVGSASLEARASTAYQIDRHTMTTFSVSAPLLLKAIKCGKIYGFDVHKFFHNGNLRLEAKLIITENRQEMSRVLYADGSVWVCNTGICLKRLILVKPGFNYTIHLKIDLSDVCSCFTNFWFKTKKVHIRPNIIVTFKNDEMFEGTKRGLIIGFKFILP